MTKHLLVFFLANLAVAFLFVGLSLLGVGAKYQRPVKVVIRSNVDVHDIVEAVQSTHRQDVDIQTLKNPPMYNTLWGIPVFAFGFMFITGLTLAFYKWFCHLLGIQPDL